ncbi:type II toxin-antitoxin system VapC family toxin [Candidatus Venteria ishoeyi]|uniref:tRNA(fMet)-specific endonuclease VapC n=1 Tax=Candidatus Venteria ishoeyi TaxID=1899563 RepID=A0A1H6FFI7_9GAMM|nr:type II toxin-antitoxin system VapC family toxin [Candidatus Venteria ishoeyi]MDM8545298.1 type II toxin-antitoxin system VapC family toxin [Candidatus Venteria ishoeyi]SEH07936.1 tRNA(fMet)-specific endonuclease VapC [Candidatus Venteria ishoeyi]
MTSYYLLDTNILSEVIKPQPSSPVLERINHYKAELATTSVVVHELLFGCLRLPLESKRRAKLHDYIHRIVLTGLPIYPYDTAAALWHSQERARLTAQGKTPPFTDGQIAAIAKVNNLILVTRNVSDFDKFEGLTVENWFA